MRYCSVTRLLLPLLLAAFMGAAPARADTLATLDMAGLTNMLRANVGKVVLVNFFATWCPPCRMEIPELAAVQKKHAGDVAVISLSVDEDAKDVPPFLKKMRAGYPVYMAGKDVVRAFGVSSIPHNVIYDRKGRQVFSEAGMLSADAVEEMLGELQSR